MASLPLSEGILNYLIPWQSLDWPVDWDEVFDGEGPLVVEIGFGNGVFLMEQAQQHPEARFVGIERAWGSVKRLFRRLEIEGLNNVRVVEGDAAFVLNNLFEPDCLDRVYIHFPDPWHKERHHSRRLIQSGFVQVLAEKLVLGGEVTIATDQAEYAEWIAEVLERQSLLAPQFGCPFVPKLPGRVPTRYEQKAMDEGMLIHYFVWRREACLSLDVTVEKVGTMPNMILEGTFDRDQFLRRFETQTWQETYRGVLVVVKLIEVYGQLKDGHRLVMAMVKEGAFQQMFGIMVVFREEGKLLIKLSPVGQPRPTWGVKQAVGRLGEVILAAHPELRVVSSTVSA